MHDTFNLDTIRKLLSSYTYIETLYQYSNEALIHKHCAHAYIKMCLQFPFCTSSFDVSCSHDGWKIYSVSLWLMMSGWKRRENTRTEKKVEIEDDAKKKKKSAQFRFFQWSIYTWLANPFDIYQHVTQFIFPIDTKICICFLG